MYNDVVTQKYEKLMLGSLSFLHIHLLHMFKKPGCKRMSDPVKRLLS